MCGGTLAGKAGIVWLLGLSPRVRGNRPLDLHPQEMTRSIPACAGEPAAANELIEVEAVYPRVCGGTFFCLSSSSNLCGLSPRVRGNRRESLHVESALGSIPACAGEPLAPDRKDAQPEVYPRVCGGTMGDRMVEAWNDGLSPRVRGNRGRSGVGADKAGSIPACAGEPIAAVKAQRNARVYPRVCGGTPGRMGRNGAEPGLSPRVRGNQEGILV